MNWSNTHVEAGNALSLTSGGDTTVKGAVASGKQVSAAIGGNLTIESLQDTSKYDSKQQSLGGSVTIGPAPGASISASQSKINSDYASVTEQSGIKAGDDGFQVTVNGNTDLKGGAITSTQAAIDQNRNRFQAGGALTLSDIQNSASYNAKAVGVNIGAGVSLDGKLAPGGSGAGVGKDSGNASSTTAAGISGIAGNAAVRTGDAPTGIGKIFDADKVQKDINAQVQITQMFNQLAPKAASSYAGNQVSTLKKQAELEQDPEKKLALQDEAKKWGANGDYNIAMNIIIGAAGGGTTGAVSSITKESLSWAADQMRQAMIEDSKKFKGLCDAQGNCINNQTGQSVGVNGDNFKLAGGRIVLLDWCTEGRCEKDPTTVTGYKESPDGRVIFKPTDTEGKPISVSQFIDQHPEWRSPMGGHQGSEGRMVLAGVSIEYKKGGFFDKLAEAYAGTHDTLNSFIWYDDLGNGRNLNGTIVGKIGDVTNITNVGVATPFALAGLLPPEVWNTVISTIKLGK